MSVTDRDMGYRDLMKAIGVMPDVAVYVGVRGAEDSDLVTYAAANEFGTADGHVPERSYLRSTVAENQSKYERAVANAVGKALDGRAPLEQGLGLVGEVAKRDVQRKIVALRDPPNAPSTVARKGSTNPLIDSGRLRQSIDYMVEVGS